ncbi:MAG: sel1 repeat family protein [Rhodospirillales bacterium]|nr:sel1 repeat family protein [Rhodospirillales bacterium]
MNSGSAPHPTFAILAVALLIRGASPVSADAQTMTSLPISNDGVVETAAASGLLGPDDFDVVADPYVSNVLVGMPPNDEEFSIVMIPGDAGPTQIQVIMTPPWEDVSARVELAAGLAEQLFTVPDSPAPPPPVQTGLEPMSPMAEWLYGLLYEAWLGWPGSEQRLIRVRDGIAVIVEGTPPDNWSITFAVDDGYADASWPGIAPDVEPAGVTAARELIRSGDYRDAHDLLLPLAEQSVPQAAFLMGDMYRFGRVGVPDIETATDWYLIAGRYRHPAAVWALAAMHTEGWGSFFLSNFKVPLLVRASEIGSPDALYLLAGAQPGVNYMRPPGVTSADQILQTAQWGMLQAQLDIAARYANGDGVEADPVEGLAWAMVAVENTGPGLDYIPARALVDDISRNLDEAQQIAAAARAGELVPGLPPWPPEGRLVPGMEGYEEPVAVEPAE